MKKRTFLQSLAAGALTAPLIFKNLDELLPPVTGVNPQALASDTDFWRQIRAGYRLKPDYINLENGYYCITPQETLDNFLHQVKYVNYEGSWYMRTVQWDNKLAVANRLADLINADHGEVVVTRNTTESLDTIIGGFPWEAGDEAVMAEQDYGAMKQMFRLVADRYGVVNKTVSVPNHPDSDDEIVQLYEQAITSKTRLLMVCHMINITGHVLPVKKICDMAHRHDVQVMVDGAHAVAHIGVDVKEIGCDYYGSSLHKWLSTPLGAGLLYVRKERIPQIWPMFGEYCCEPDDIRRLNHTGTHPVHTDLAINAAIDYYNRIGGQRKEERLRYLQKYWTDQVREIRGVTVNTPVDPHRSCGIGNVGIDGLKPHDMADRLLSEHRIWTVAIDGAGVQGCRITPNIYTTTEELDTFVDAIRNLARA